jgi:putative transposase
VRKAFKYRLYPTRQQDAAMSAMLETHRRLYNDALSERKQAWEQERRGVTYGEQSGQLKAARKTNPFLAATNFSSCQATLRRLDKTFQAFFRRMKAGETPGYPRFKGRHRFDTVEFPSYGDGCRFDGRCVYFQHVGRVKVKLHRPIEGQIKTIAFKREADGWYVVFSCDLGDVAVPPSSGPAVGIDLGLKAFLVTSEGESVAPPQHYRRVQAALRRAQRKVARRQKGSKRRAKAVHALQKQHQRITNLRRDFHHKTARALVMRYGTVIHEDLNIHGIARSRLAKSTLDVAWGSFLQILSYKAEEAGATVIVAVPPHNTTQVCSRCGVVPDVPKSLADRVHSCALCGYVADRDLNAAQNILRLGSSLQDRTCANRRSVS